MVRSNSYRLNSLTRRMFITGVCKFPFAKNVLPRKKRILVIDDEEVTTFGFAMVLKENNVEIDCANLLQDARVLIAAHQYDAAIVDLRLSNSIELEGFECIQLLRSRMDNCKIIVLTAFGDHIVRARASALGVDRFVVKPLEPDQLRKLLEMLNVYD